MDLRRLRLDFQVIPAWGRGLIPCWIGAALGLLGGCIPEGGTSSGTESSLTLEGGVVFADGRPAEGANISLFRIDSALGARGPGQPFVTVLSDRDGRYAFTDLGTAVYSLQAAYAGSPQEDSLKAGRTSIRLSHSLDVGIDTLRQPGYVVGKVLADGIPLLGAFCFIPGTSHVATSDSAGQCVLAGVAPGTYETAFWAEGRLLLKVSPVVVHPGKWTVLDPVSLFRNPSLLPPPPEGLEAAYDRESGTVLLRWKNMERAGIQGYLLFRSAKGEVRGRLLVDSILRDTVFRDTLYRGTHKPDSGVFIYHLKAIDSNANESPFGAPATISFVAPPGILAPYPGNRSQAMDTAFELGWILSNPTGTGATRGQVLLDTQDPPVRILSEPGSATEAAVAGLLPGQTYFWRVRCQVDTLPIEGPIWSFRTREQGDGSDTTEIAYVDLRGTSGHFRVRTVGGACLGCGERADFSGPLLVDFGPAPTAVVQVYRNSQAVPVFPAENPNQVYAKGTAILLDPGDRSYELKVWKPGEPSPRMSFWFSIVRD